MPELSEPEPGHGDLTRTPFYADAKFVLEPAVLFVGAGVILGGVAAAIMNTLRPHRRVSYGEWSAYTGAILGVAAAAVQLFALWGVA
jgi:hypothetical protein